MYYNTSVLPESIPWLIAKNRIPEAKQILAKAAKFNKIELPNEYQLTEDEKKLLKNQKLFSRKNPFNPESENTSQGDSSKATHAKDESNYVFTDICKSPRLLLYSVIMCYIW